MIVSSWHQVSPYNQAHRLAVGRCPLLKFNTFMVASNSVFIGLPAVVADVQGLR